MERPGAVTVNGKPYTLLGPELRPGDPAPDFVCLDTKLQPVDLEATGTNIRIFSVVPSLDTPVCDMQTKRFDQEAARLEGVDVFTISMDLPFAQKRYCDTFGVDHVKMLSDYRDAAFGINYGTLIKELRLECRAIFVLDRNNVIRYAEYVKEVTNHPNYDAVLATVRSLLQEQAA